MTLINIDPINNSKEIVNSVTLICQAAKDQKLPENGDLAILYKTSAEIMLLAKDYTNPKPLLEEAIKLLSQVTEIDCTNLINSCKSLLLFCK